MSLKAGVLKDVGGGRIGGGRGGEREGVVCWLAVERKRLLSHRKWRCCPTVIPTHRNNIAAYMNDYRISVCFFPLPRR